MISFIRDKVLAVRFEVLFFTILPGHNLFMECLLGHSYDITYKSQLSEQKQAHRTGFYLNNRLNAPLNLKEV